MKIDGNLILIDQFYKNWFLYHLDSLIKKDPDYPEHYVLSKKRNFKIIKRNFKIEKLVIMSKAKEKQTYNFMAVLSKI